MKKMFYLMTAVIVALTFNACSVEDNPATPSKPSGRAVITINTAALYEEIDATEGMKDALANNFVLVDTVLIYNENGHLVSKLGTEARNLEPQTIVADNLPDGTYTLIAWQTAYYDSVEDKFVASEISREEELANVSLSLVEPFLEYKFAIGMASATVTVAGNTLEATISPKLVGSIVDFKTETNVKENGYLEVNLYRMYETCTGFYLDPARTKDDRWIVENIEGYANGIAYVAEDESHYPHYTLEHGDDMVVSLIGWNPDYSYEVIFEDAHQKLQADSRAVYYFDLSRMSFQPPFCGSEEDFLVWKADRDAGKLVNEPYLEWGGSLAEVEKHIQAKQYWAEYTDKIEFWEEEGWHRWFWVAGLLTEQYIFETEDGQNLIKASSFCHDETVPIEVAHKSLGLQGYTYLGKLHYPDSEEYKDMFLSADGKTKVLTYYNYYGGWVIDYYPLNPDDLNYIIPADEAPARSMIYRVVPSNRHSVNRSATTSDGLIRPIGLRR